MVRFGVIKISKFDQSLTMHVLIAGGTGFIGKALREKLKEQGIESSVLTRTPSAPHHIGWDPERGKIDAVKLPKVTHVINLAGAGIAEKRWTEKRKKELRESRTRTTEFLHVSMVKYAKDVVNYIGISGVNAFGFLDNKVYNESDDFGNDFLSQLVKEWEKAHRLFEALPFFSILRLGMVLSPKGGAYQKIAQPIKWGLGAVPGSGQQLVPWIHLEDTVQLIIACLKAPKGLVHAVVECATMNDITFAIAASEKKKIFLPNIPSFVIHIRFGEMGHLLTKSLRVSNTNLFKTFQPSYNQLSLLKN